MCVSRTLSSLSQSHIHNRLRHTSRLSSLVHSSRLNVRWALHHHRVLWLLVVMNITMNHHRIWRTKNIIRRTQGPHRDVVDSDDNDAGEVDVPIEGDELKQLLLQQERKDVEIVAEMFEEARTISDQATAESYVESFGKSSEELMAQLERTAKAKKCTRKKLQVF